MCRFGRLCENVCNHSTSYMVLISSYSVSLYELWSQNNKMRDNLTTTFLLLIPIIFGLLEIADIQILNLFRNETKINQKKLLSKLEEVAILMNNSLTENENENAKFISNFKYKIDKIKNAFSGFEEKLNKINQLEKNKINEGERKRKRKGKGKGKKKKH